ncbi:MAG: hypothetical protein M3Z20_18220, partial [Chloroflexota bacterium]|nr:hypothetical protein [Chloroflexota bacterium]
QGDGEALLLLLYRSIALTNCILGQVLQSIQGRTCVQLNLATYIPIRMDHILCPLTQAFERDREPG